MLYVYKLEKYGNILYVYKERFVYVYIYMRMINTKIKHKKRHFGRAPSQALRH